ncbi:hypothetical protein NA57DRAFT_75802 [Rhizodiscina lignyota]|uniref:Uncharacterized protein n=1 Tax=Rhizodiscina lignyota TaxID=1504668 RepID=A0A9P4M8P4_9PEZI|nr:hypothetical protein NA57DRAFT_75802 [Rhizodiscina lignyota]
MYPVNQMAPTQTRHQAPTVHPPPVPEEPIAHQNAAQLPGAWPASSEWEADMWDGSGGRHHYSKNHIRWTKAAAEIQNDYENKWDELSSDITALRQITKLKAAVVEELWQEMYRGEFDVDIFAALKDIDKVSAILLKRLHSQYQRGHGLLRFSSEKAGSLLVDVSRDRGYFRGIPSKAVPDPEALLLEATEMTMVRKSHVFLLTA